MAEKNHRRCISCRTTLHRDQLWRIVRTAGSHNIQIDSGMGRSAYLCPTLQCLSAAQKKNKLSRMLRAPVPPDIYQYLEKRLSGSKRPEPPSVSSVMTAHKLSCSKE